MPSDPDLAVIRSWCGSKVGTSEADRFTPDDLDERLGRLRTAEAVALEIMRQQRADLLARPAQFQLDGDYSATTSSNLEALEKDIAKLEQIVGSGGGAVTTTRLRRRGRRR